MNIPAEQYPIITGVLVHTHWYNVRKGTFRGAGGGAFTFDYQMPRDSYTSIKRSMTVKAEQIQAVQTTEGAA